MRRQRIRKTLTTDGSAVFLQNITYPEPGDSFPPLVSKKWDIQIGGSTTHLGKIFTQELFQLLANKHPPWFPPFPYNIDERIVTELHIFCVECGQFRNPQRRFIKGAEHDHVPVTFRRRSIGGGQQCSGLGFIKVPGNLRMALSLWY